MEPGIPAHCAILFSFAGPGHGDAVLLQFAFMESSRMLMELLWRGQTVGKKMMGLRVVDEQGLKLRVSQVVIRNLLRFVDMLPFLCTRWSGVLFSSRAQRLGDLAAGTVVIRTVKSEPGCGGCWQVSSTPSGNPSH